MRLVAIIAIFMASPVAANDEGYSIGDAVQSIQEDIDVESVDPDPTPGEFNIQFPEIRLTGIAGLASSAEYRDRLTSNGASASLSASAAAQGFSVSGWQSWELSSGRTAGEFLAGYSFKLPGVDVHSAVVVCHNDAFIGGCPESIRVGLTSNTFESTTIEVFYDQPFKSTNLSLSAGITQDLWSNDRISTAFRLSGTHTTFGDIGNYYGVSARLIGSFAINQDLAFDVAAGHIWSGGTASPVGSNNGFVVVTSIVWRQ